MSIRNEAPAWSPDGRRVIYVSHWWSEIYVMNADGTGVRKLTKGASPAWQPVAPGEE
jgi:Tol biopolymer transport system component